MVQHFRHLILSAILVSTTSIVYADPLSDRLNQILSFATSRDGINGVIVERVSDKKIIFEQNPDLRLMPASNRKLFTSAVGLEVLGDSWQPETDILSTSPMDAQGVIHGDVIVKGGGDSTLTADDYAAMAAQLSSMGVKSIQGDIIADASLFTDGPYGAEWGWDYLSDDYAPQISALEVNRGVVTVLINPGANLGDPVTVTLKPDIPFMTINDSAKTSQGTTVVGGHLPIEPSDPPDTLTVQREWDKNVIDVTGTLPQNAPVTIDITVADPTRYAATVFATDLVKDGIVLSGHVVEGTCPQGAGVLIKHEGPKIADYIKLMNKPSDNLLAESLIRLVGAAKGKGGDYDDGHVVESQFLTSLNIDTSKLTLADGCGVSRRNFVTARAVANLLVAMHARPDWNVYYDSLPVAGVDGTLRKRMKATVAAGNVHAKTGSLGAVSCLSGYVAAHDGRLYVFSVLNNNFSGSTNDIRKMQDQFSEAIASGL